MKFFLISVILIVVVPSLTNSEQILKNVVRKARQNLPDLLQDLKELFDKLGTGKCSNEQFAAMDLLPCINGMYTK